MLSELQNKDILSIVKGSLYTALGISILYLLITGQYKFYVAPRYELFFITSRHRLFYVVASSLYYGHLLNSISTIGALLSLSLFPLYY